MKNAFDGFISRVYTAEKRISELGDMSVETYKTEMLRGKRNRISKNCGTITKDITYL